MKFIQVDPNEIDNLRQSRRGRVSYPILKSFLETNFYIAEMDLTGVQQSKQALTSSLTAYIRNHGLPIKMFHRGGKIYLARLDIDEKGNAIPDWQEQSVNNHISQSLDEATLTTELVEKKFPVESKKVTK